MFISIIVLEGELPLENSADLAYYSVMTQGNVEHPLGQAFISWIEELVERRQRDADQSP